MVGDGFDLINALFPLIFLHVEAFEDLIALVVPLEIGNLVG